MFGNVFSFVIAGMASGLLAPALVAGAGRVTLSFETQGLDLDSGTIVGEGSRLDVFTDHPEADIRIGYHADRAVHSVVVHNSARGVELALLSNTAFERVTASSLACIDFTADVVDQPFQPGDTFVVLTNAGHSYKFGNADANGAEVSFDYEPLGATDASSVDTGPAPADGLAASNSRHTRSEVPKTTFGAALEELGRVCFVLMLAALMSAIVLRRRVGSFRIAARTALGVCVHERRGGMVADGEAHGERRCRG